MTDADSPVALQYETAPATPRTVSRALAIASHAIGAGVIFWAFVIVSLSVIGEAHLLLSPFLLIEIAKMSSWMLASECVGFGLASLMVRVSAMRRLRLTYLVCGFSGMLSEILLFVFSYLTGFAAFQVVVGMMMFACASFLVGLICLGILRSVAQPRTTSS